MIIIDTDAEQILIDKLETLRTQPTAGIGLSYLIHLPLAQDAAQKEVAEHLQRAIVLHVQNTAPANSQIFLSGDEDVFILTSAVNLAEIKKFLHDITLQLPESLSDAGVAVYQLALHMTRILALLQERIDRRREAAEAVRKKQADTQTEQRRHSILDTGVIGHKAHAIAAQRRQRSKAEIMIIEDDPFSRRLVQNVLQSQYSLTVLGDAQLALATYAHKAPDVLFLDINLPDVTGHELLEKIIALDPDAYVVMLSGNADRENILRAMNKGAKGFVGKPFSCEKLFHYIRNCPTIRTHN